METMKLTDTGTRYRFYRELLELWQDGLEVLGRIGGYKTEGDKEKETKLQGGIELLQRQLDIMSGYEDGMYSNTVYPLMKLVNQLPGPEEIQGGRGTPLR